MILPILISLLVLVAALGAVLVARTVHAALWMALSLSMVGVLYLVLGADFIGLVQFTVYVGAVAVLMIFALLITRRADEEAEAQARGKSLLLWLVCVVPVLFALLYVAFVSYRGKLNAPLPEATAKLDLAALGQVLYTDYAPAVLAVAVMLTAVLIGASIIARKDNPEI